VRDRRLAALVGGHGALVAVLVIGTVLRVGTEIAYRPALFFGDSWRYLHMTFSGFPVGILPSRPSGYPLLLRLLTAPGRDVLLVTVAQHIAGLVVGVLVYVLLLRLGLRRLHAALAAAVVLWDSYAIALEQFIMAETFFTLLLVGALTLTVTHRSSGRALVLAGAMLAAACTLRTAGVFVIPVWLAYVFWRAPGRRRRLLALAGVMVPLLMYGSWHAVRTDGSFGLDQTQGWFLYGRVAQLADCRGATVPAPTRPLCDIPPAWRRAFPPGTWIWGMGAPAVWLFGGTPDAHAEQPGGGVIVARNNTLLEQFALGIIRAHPAAYLNAVATDFLRFFDPTADPGPDPDDDTVTFPSAPLTGWVWPGPRDRYQPGYVPRVRWPAPLLSAYQSVFHAPRLLLALLALAALMALLVPPLSRRRIQLERRPELLLLAGAGLAMLLGSAIFVGFVVRYLIPSVPLVLAGGAVAVNEFVRARAVRPWTRAPVRTVTARG
jgi:4-amino-4-deoxy-L-arabinose transferase-like glycosyltransferase